MTGSKKVSGDSVATFETEAEEVSNSAVSDDAATPKGVTRGEEPKLRSSQTWRAKFHFLWVFKIKYICPGLKKDWYRAPLFLGSSQSCFCCFGPI